MAGAKPIWQKLGILGKKLLLPNFLNFLREGINCNKCVPLGGCLHGDCVKPFECNCQLAKNETKRGKYIGPHCDIRKCL